MIGDFLYALTARDSQSPLLESHAEEMTVTAANATVDVRHTVEPGFIYLLKNCYARATPGAAQSVSRLILTMDDQSGNGTILSESLGNSAGTGSGPLIGFASFAAGLSVALDKQFTDILIAPGWSVRARGIFTAGVNPNSVMLDLVAIRLPRGNISGL